LLSPAEPCPPGRDGALDRDAVPVADVDEKPGLSFDVDIREVLSCSGQGNLIGLPVIGKDEAGRARVSRVDSLKVR
jgi:hypothetical protein